MAYKTIKPADALKLFKGQTITVQTAKEVEKEVDGKKRKVFETKNEPLAEKLVLSAKEWDDGRVTITTIDGRKHEANGAAASA